MAFSIPEAIILALIQGLTEWVPVSSSGHLAIAELALGSPVPLLFNLAVHVGTLAAVVWVFRDLVLKITKAIPRMLTHAIHMRIPPHEDHNAKLALFLMLATIPVATIGFLLKDLAEASFHEPLALAGFFMFSGLILLSTKGILSEERLDPKNIMKVGVSQILAVFPGVSRSGITIAAGIHAGMDRKAAAEFSFLLSIPLIIGATIYEAFSTTISTDIYPHLVIGMILSFITGALTIKFLEKVIAHGKLYWFAPYCIGMGFALVMIYIL